MLLAAAGCGDDEPSAAYRACRAETENAARAEVVRIAYEQGRIGTRAEIEADLPAAKEFFDAEGNMLRYEELDGITRSRFDRWVANDDYLAGPVQREAFAAQDRVADQGWPGCDDLK